MGFLSNVWAKISGVALVIAGVLLALLKRERKQRKQAERKARLYVVKSEITERVSGADKKLEVSEDEEINRKAKEARDNWRDHINDQ